MTTTDSKRNTTTLALEFRILARKLEGQAFESLGNGRTGEAELLFESADDAFADAQAIDPAS